VQRRKRGSAGRWIALSAVVAVVLAVIAISLTGGGGGSTSGCPSSFPQPPRSRGPATRATLVPLQGLTDATVCRYQGLLGESGEHEPGDLAGSRAMGAEAAAKLARSLNGLRRGLKVNANTLLHCPAAVGGKVYLSFGYRHSRPIAVRVSQSGCRLIGSVGFGYVYALPRWLGVKLEALTPG
jgi:hypothetical protein